MNKSKDLWWQEYRRRKFRPRRVVNIEVVLRNIFKKCCREYRNNCSIAGVKQMTDPDIGLWQRMIWIVVFATMCGTFFYFFWYLWFESLAKPLIVTMESSTYPIAEIDFPAIAVCNVNRISKKALFEFETKILKRNISHYTEIIAKQFGGLLDYTYYETLKSHTHLDSEKNTGHDAERVIKTMKFLAPRCEEMLVECLWAGKPMDCKSLFTVRRTMRGHCCAFNYVLDYDAAGTPNKTIAKIKRQIEPGFLRGLNLVMDPLLEDYAYATRHILGLEILIFDPTHYADPHGGRVVQRIAEPNMALFLELHSIKQIATNEVRKYPLKTRNCLFRDERRDKFNNMYSYSACIVNCRTKTVQSLCKCTPYFVPTSSRLPTCTLDELTCLNKHKEKLLFMYPMGADNTQGLEIESRDSLYCPDCYPDCEFTKHKTRAHEIPLPQVYIDHGRSEYRKLFKTEINMTNKCLISVYQSTLHGTLERLDVVAYWFELLSNVGGVGGILMGLSSIAVIEFIFFFVITFLKEIFNLFFITNKN